MYILNDCAKLNLVGTNKTFYCTFSYYGSKTGFLNVVGNIERGIHQK